MDLITLIMLFDTHLHLRVGSMMETAVPLIAPYCQAGVVMPNTANIRTSEDAIRHRRGIRSIAAKAGYPDFNPLMTIMLTDETDPADVKYWPESGVVAGKDYPMDLYPHGGVSSVFKIRDVVNEMSRVGIPYSKHFEKAGVHPLEAELAALPDFYYLADSFPNLPIIFEHASTAKAIDAVMQYGSNVVATITPQHLWQTKEDVFDRNGVVRYPHNWCRPPMKTADDREALRDAAMSGNPKIFFGSDFAPHPPSNKGAENPSAGVANCLATLPLLVTLFEQYDRLGQLDAFASGNAAKFYGIELRDEWIILERRPFTVPASIPLLGTDGVRPEDRIIPWLAGKEFPWSRAV